MATEKRLIWGDIAEEHLTKLAEWYKGSFSGDAFERAAREIAELPSVDAVEVVRCKDCKYYEHPEYYGGGTKDVCRTFKRQMREDDFCSYGGRKDND